MAKLYCVDNSGDELWRLNPANPFSTAGAYGLVGDLPNFLGNPTGITAHDGDLYCADNAGNELWRINPDNPSDETGRFGLVGVFPSGLSTPSGLASHAGSLYCTDDSGNELWRINPEDPSDETGDFGLVGVLPSGLTSPRGITSHDGSLYCTDNSGNELFRINPDNPSDASGNFGRIGQLPAGIDSPNGITSHEEGLYIINSANDTLWLVNPANPGDESGDFGNLGDVPSGVTNPLGLASLPDDFDADATPSTFNIEAGSVEGEFVATPHDGDSSASNFTIEAASPTGTASIPYDGDATPTEFSFESSEPIGETIPPEFTGDAQAASWSFETPLATGVVFADNSDSEPSTWVFETSEPTGETTPPEFTVAAEPSVWTFEVSEPEGETTPPEFAEDSGSSAWSFEGSEPTGETVPPEFTADAQASSWSLEATEPTGETASPAYSGNARPSNWAFDTPNVFIVESSIIQAVAEDNLRLLIDGKLFNTRESPSRYSVVRYEDASISAPLNGLPTAEIGIQEVGVRENYRERQIDAHGVRAFFPMERKANGDISAVDIVGTSTVTLHDDVAASTLSPAVSLVGSIDTTSVDSGEDPIESSLKISSRNWGLRAWVRMSNIAGSSKRVIMHILSGTTRVLDVYYQSNGFKLDIRYGTASTLKSASVDVPDGFVANQWVLVSVWREENRVAIAVNDQPSDWADIGDDTSFAPIGSVSFGRNLNGYISAIAWTHGRTGEEVNEVERSNTRFVLFESTSISRLADIDVGLDVLITTSQEPYRDMALRLLPAVYYSLDENGTIVNAQEEIILEDISGNSRDAVASSPSLSELNVKKNSSHSDIGHIETVGSVDLDEAVIATDSLSADRQGQISIHDPGGRFIDINIGFGFKRPNDVDHGGVLGLYCNDIALGDDLEDIDKGIPIYIDTSESYKTRFILKKGAIGRTGDDDALESDEGKWFHPDGKDEGTRVYGREFVSTVNFDTENSNKNAVLEISHPESGEDAVVWLPSTGTRSAADVNDATEFRFRVIGDDRRLKLFAVGDLGSFLIAVAEFDDSWFPFETDDSGSFVNPGSGGEYIFFQSDPDNEADNAMLFLRFGPRSQIDFRYRELLDCAVPYGGALRARLSSEDQTAIVHEDDETVDDVVTVCVWGFIEAIGDDPIILARRMNSDGDGWELGFNSDRKPYMKYVDGSTSITATTKGVVELEQWAHLCGVVSGTSVDIWINGDKQDSKTNSSTDQPDSADLVFAQSDDSSRVLLDEIAVFAKVLPDDDIAGLYTARSGERLFSGYVTSPDFKVAQNIREASLDVSGHADRLFRIKVYPDPDNLVLVAPAKRQLGDIATDLIRFYAKDEGITTHGIRQVGEIEREVFGIQSIAESLDTLSTRHATEATEGSMAQIWGVDTWKDAYFRQRGLIFRYPFRITDRLISSAGYSRDITEFGNVFYVTGGPDSVGQRQEDRFFGDGTTREFQLRYPAREIFEVYFDNQLEAHTGDGKLWEFDPEGFILKRISGEDAPAIGEELIVDYRFSFPTLGVARSKDSIARYGRFERSLEDETIDEAELLRSRAIDNVSVHDDPSTVIDVKLIPGALTQNGWPLIREGMLLPIDLRRVNDNLRNVDALVDSHEMDTEDGYVIHSLSLKIKDHEDTRVGHWKRQRTPVRTPAVRFQVATSDRADPGDVLFSGLGLPLALGGTGAVWLRKKSWVNIPEHVVGRFDGSQLAGITALVFFMAQVKSSTETDDTRLAEVRLWNTTNGFQVGTTAKVSSTTALGHVVRRVTLTDSLSNYVLQAKCNSNCRGLRIWQAQILAGTR